MKEKEDIEREVWEEFRRGNHTLRWSPDLLGFLSDKIDDDLGLRRVDIMYEIHYNFFSQKKRETYSRKSNKYKFKYVLKKYGSALPFLKFSNVKNDLKQFAQKHYLEQIVKERLTCNQP